MQPARALLVPGAHMGAWCWLPVLERLDRAGVPAEAIDLPFSGFADDVAAVDDRIASMAASGPVVAVAHSYSGMVVAAAGASAARLVIVAGRLPRRGESQAELTPAWNHPALRDAMVSGPDGLVRLVAGGRAALFSGSPANLADFAMAHARPMRSRVPEEPIPDPAWYRVPSLYVVCTADRAVRVEAQRERAALVGEFVELDCDHSPFFSAPDQLAEVIATQVRRAAVVH